MVIPDIMEKKLEEIQWSEAWDVGIMTIDQSHREFVTLLNRVIRIINEEACPVSLSEIFFALIHYAENHFIREEILLRDARYTDLDKHQQKHAAFIEKIRSLREKFSAGDTGVCMELYEYLTGWLREHILRYDQDTLSFLKHQGLS
jgi:hemerythrin